MGNRCGEHFLQAQTNNCPENTCKRGREDWFSVEESLGLLSEFIILVLAKPIIYGSELGDA